MNFVTPLVIELGEAAEADVEALLEGKGTLADDIEEVMRLIRQHASASKDARIFVPVVAIYDTDD
jgi:hypothetical protein